MRKSILILAGLLCVVACSQTIESPESETENAVRPTIIANSPSYSSSPSTRTEIETLYDDEGKVKEIHTYWSAEDELIVYNWVDGVTITEVPNNYYTTSWSFYFDSDQPSQTAVFELEDPYFQPLDDASLVAIHPLGDSDRLEHYFSPGSDGLFYGGIDFNIPVIQHPRALTFDSDADLLVSECFSFDSENPVVTDLSFTRMNAIVKINFVDKTEHSLFSKGGIYSVIFGPETGDKYLTGWAFCFPHEGMYELYMAAYPEDYDELVEEYPAYPYVSAEYSSNDHPSIGAIDAVYLLVHPTTLKSEDYPDGLPIKVIVENWGCTYTVTRMVTLPPDGIELPAGLVTTLNISLYDDGINGTTVSEYWPLN